MFIAVFGFLCLVFAAAMLVNVLGGYRILTSNVWLEYPGPAFVESIYVRLPDGLFVPAGFFATFFAVTAVALAGGSVSLILGYPLVLAGIYFVGKAALGVIKALKSLKTVRSR